MSELPPRIGTLIVPEQLIAESRTLLDPCLAQRVEGCILWYGSVISPDQCLVRLVLRPAQISRPGSYDITAEGMRNVRRQTRPLGLLLIMQIHTHPKLAFFSDWDAENALNKRPGALNLILPNYGNVQWLDQKEMCVVELDHRGRWNPWSHDDWKRINVVRGIADAP